MTTFSSPSTTSGSQAQTKLETVFDQAGITVNGSKAQDIQVHDPAFFAGVAKLHTQGIAEAYVRGQVSFRDQVAFWDHLLAPVPDRPGTIFAELLPVSTTLKTRLAKSKIKRAFHLINPFDIARKHYDIPPFLFLSFLGDTKAYTCGFFDFNEDPDPLSLEALNTAQNRKLKYHADYLEIADGKTILEIGPGWGSLANFLQENYPNTKFSYVGLNVSQNQIAHCREYFANDERFEFVLQDFGEPLLTPSGKARTFDGIVSLGMIKHCGRERQTEFFRAIRQASHLGSKVSLQIIVSRKYREIAEPFLSEYIFPEADISPDEYYLGQFTAHRRFQLERYRRSSRHYAQTLKNWLRQFSLNWTETEPPVEEYLHENPHPLCRSSQEMYRLFEAYFSLCVAGFNQREYSLTTLQGIPTPGWKE